MHSEIFDFGGVAGENNRLNLNHRDAAEIRGLIAQSMVLRASLQWLRHRVTSLFGASTVLRAEVSSLGSGLILTIDTTLPTREALAKLGTLEDLWLLEAESVQKIFFDVRIS